MWKIRFKKRHVSYVKNVTFIAILPVPRFVKRDLYHVMMAKRPASSVKEICIRFSKKTYVICEKCHMYSDFVCPSVGHQKRPILYHDGKETCIICKRDLYHMYSDFVCPSVGQERPISYNIKRDLYHDEKETCIIRKRDPHHMKKKPMAYVKNVMCKAILHVPRFCKRDLYDSQKRPVW